MDIHQYKERYVFWVNDKGCNEQMSNQMGKAGVS